MANEKLEQVYEKELANVTKQTLTHFLLMLKEMRTNMMKNGEYKDAVKLQDFILAASLYPADVSVVKVDRGQEEKFKKMLDENGVKYNYSNTFSWDGSAGLFFMPKKAWDKLYEMNEKRSDGEKLFNPVNIDGRSIGDNDRVGDEEYDDEDAGFEDADKETADESEKHKKKGEKDVREHGDDREERDGPEEDDEDGEDSGENSDEDADKEVDENSEDDSEEGEEVDDDGEHKDDKKDKKKDKDKKDKDKKDRKDEEKKEEPAEPENEPESEAIEVESEESIKSPEDELSFYQPQEEDYENFDFDADDNISTAEKEPETHENSEKPVFTQEDTAFSFDDDNVPPEKRGEVQEPATEDNFVYDQSSFSEQAENNAHEQAEEPSCDANRENAADYSEDESERWWENGYQAESSYKEGEGTASKYGNQVESAGTENQCTQEEGYKTQNYGQYGLPDSRNESAGTQPVEPSYQGPQPYDQSSADYAGEPYNPLQQDIHYEQTDDTRNVATEPIASSGAVSDVENEQNNNALYGAMGATAAFGAEEAGRQSEESYAADLGNVGYPDSNAGYQESEDNNTQPAYDNQYSNVAGYDTYNGYNNNAGGYQNNTFNQGQTSEIESSRAPEQVQQNPFAVQNNFVGAQTSGVGIELQTDLYQKQPYQPQNQFVGQQPATQNEPQFISSQGGVESTGTQTAPESVHNAFADTQAQNTNTAPTTPQAFEDRNNGVPDLGRQDATQYDTGSSNEQPHQHQQSVPTASGYNNSQYSAEPQPTPHNAFHREEQAQKADNHNGARPEQTATPVHSPFVESGSQAVEGQQSSAQAIHNAYTQQTQQQKSAAESSYNTQETSTEQPANTHNAFADNNVQTGIPAIREEHPAETSFVGAATGPVHAVVDNGTYTGNTQNESTRVVEPTATGTAQPQEQPHIMPEARADGQGVKPSQEAATAHNAFIQPQNTTGTAIHKGAAPEQRGAAFDSHQTGIPTAHNASTAQEVVSSKVGAEGAGPIAGERPRVSVGDTLQGTRIVDGKPIMPGASTPVKPGGMREASVTAGKPGTSNGAIAASKAEDKSPANVTVASGMNLQEHASHDSLYKAVLNMSAAGVKSTVDQSTAHKPLEQTKEGLHAARMITMFVAGAPIKEADAYRHLTRAMNGIERDENGKIIRHKGIELTETGKENTDMLKAILSTRGDEKGKRRKIEEYDLSTTKGLALFMDDLDRLSKDAHITKTTNIGQKYAGTRHSHGSKTYSADFIKKEIERVKGKGAVTDKEAQQLANALRAANHGRNGLANRSLYRKTTGRKEALKSLGEYVTLNPYKNRLAKDAIQQDEATASTGNTLSKVSSTRHTLSEVNRFMIRRAKTNKARYLKKRDVLKKKQVKLSENIKRIKAQGGRANSIKLLHYQTRYARVRGHQVKLAAKRAARPASQFVHTGLDVVLNPDEYLIRGAKYAGKRGGKAALHGAKKVGNVGIHAAKKGLNHIDKKGLAHQAKEKLKKKVTDGAEKVANSRVGVIVSKVFNRGKSGFKLAGKILNAPFNAIGSVQRLITKFIITVMKPFAVMLLALGAVMIFAAIMQAISLQILSFFYDNQLLAKVDYEAIQSSVMNNVYESVLDEETDWVKNLKDGYIDQSRPPKPGDLAYTLFNPDGTLNPATTDITLEEYVPRALHTEVKDGAVKGPKPWEEAPAEAYKWIKKIDGGVEVRTPYPSNAKDIVAMTAVAKQESEQSEAESEAMDEGNKEDGIFDKMDGVFGKLRSMFHFVSNATSNFVNATMPHLSKLITNGASEVIQNGEIKSYLLYAQPLFTQSHQEKAGLTMSLMPTKKTQGKVHASWDTTTSLMTQEQVQEAIDAGADVVNTTDLAQSSNAKIKYTEDEAVLTAFVLTGDGVSWRGEIGQTDDAGLIAVAETVRNSVLTNYNHNGKSVMEQITANRQWHNYTMGLSRMAEGKKPLAHTLEIVKGVFDGKLGVLNDIRCVGQTTAGSGPNGCAGPHPQLKRTIAGHDFWLDTTIGNISVTMAGHGDEAETEIYNMAQAVVVDDGLCPGGHFGYGEMEYKGFYLETKDPENPYYKTPDGRMIKEESVTPSYMAGNILDTCLAPTDKSAQPGLTFLKALATHPDCWQMIDENGNEVSLPYLPPETDWENDPQDDIDFSAEDSLKDVALDHLKAIGLTLQGYMPHSEDGGETYSIDIITAKKSEQGNQLDDEGNPMYRSDDVKHEHPVQINRKLRKRRTFRFKHKCAGDHVGYYCGGHLKLIVTAYVYHIEKYEVNQNHSRYEDKTLYDDYKITSKPLNGKALAASSLANSAPVALISSFNTSIEIKRAKFLADATSGVDADAMKRAKDIFDVDMAIIHPLGGPANTFLGWKYDNIDLAAQKVQDDWKQMYGIDEVHVIGGSAQDMFSAQQAAEYSTLDSSDSTLDDVMINGMTGSAIVKNAVTTAYYFCGSVVYDQNGHGTALNKGGTYNDCTGYIAQCYGPILPYAYNTTAFYNMAIQYHALKKYDAAKIRKGDIILSGMHTGNYGDQHALLSTGDGMSIDCSSPGATHRDRGANYYARTEYIDMRILIPALAKATGGKTAMLHDMYDIPGNTRDYRIGGPKKEEKKDDT